MLAWVIQVLTLTGLLVFQSCLSSSSDSSAITATDDSSDSSDSDSQASNDSSSEVTLNYTALGDFSVTEGVASSEVFNLDSTSGGDTDSAGNAVTYACVYDTTIDEAVASGTDCSNISGLSFDTSTGVLSWTPTYDARDNGDGSGRYEIKVTATAGSLSYSEVVIITVNHTAAGWVTQLGDTTLPAGGSSSLDDYCWGIAVDSGGNIYCGGNTSSSLGENNGGGDDAFVMKLNSSGEIIWLTQFGDATLPARGDSSAGDWCNSVAVDSSGNVYCAGGTNSSLGETNGGSVDIFIAKLNSSGALQWLTQLGDTTLPAGGSSTSYDNCAGVAVDSSGDVYCAG